MTKDIQQAVCKWLAQSGNEAICENYTHSWEMDVACMSKSGFIYEFEVKISRSDFLADKKKIGKFASYEMKNERSAPNYFCYVCPHGLIESHEIPSYAGLYYYCEDGSINIIKGVTRIHKAKVDKEKVLKKMLRLNIQRKYLGGSWLTYKNRKSAELYKQYEKEKLESLEISQSMFPEK